MHELVKVISLNNFIECFKNKKYEFHQFFTKIFKFKIIQKLQAKYNLKTRNFCFLLQYFLLSSIS